MRSVRHRLPETRRGVVVAAFLVTAMIFGGGGSPSAAAEIIVQLAFGVALLAWIWWARGEEATAGPSRLLVGLGLAMLALPIIQLVPLPPAIWPSLPGRDLVGASLAIIGVQEAWHAMSVAPWRTLSALLAMIPAVGVMLGASTLGRRDRRFLVLSIALVALLGAAYGVVQMAGGPGAFRMYEVSHDFWLTAFYANRNAAVDFLLIGSLALTAWLAGLSGRRPLLRSDLAIVVILQAFLALAIILTGSRTGIALLPLALLIQFAMLRSAGIARGLSNGLASAGGMLVLVAGAAILFAGNARIGAALARFDASRDSRIDLWQDTWTAVGAFWPAGSGLGTYTRAFLPFERFAVLDQLFPNRAHNDYLEFLLEAGVLAPVLLAAGFIILALLAWRAWHRRPDERSTTLFALGIFMVIGLHSFVDYPLRTMALACLAGTAAGLLGALARKDQDGRETGAMT